jgi:hypothetical protein
LLSLSVESSVVKRVLIVVALLAGCFVPSVPVPPPAPEASTFALDTMMGTIRYSANYGNDWANSWVVIRCEETGQGAVTRSDAGGRVADSEPFACLEGDHVFVDLERDDGPRIGFCLIVHDGPSNDNFECD